MDLTKKIEWTIKSLILIIVCGGLFVLPIKEKYRNNKIIVVELKDTKINGPMGNSLNADSIISPLKKAISKSPKLIIIKADSVGGRIVQGERIYNYIKSIDIPIHTVIDNSCLSSCYYAISSSDKIYSSKNSEIGSIGVIHYAAPKSQLDNMPIVSTYSGIFKNPTPEAEYIQKHMTSIAKIMHNVVIEDIKKARGKKLTGTDKELFQGLIWDGIRAKEKGLIDNFGTVESLLK